MSVSLSDLVQFLDRYLNISSVPDSATAFNGLQVENAGTVSRVLSAVDASQASIQAALDTDSDFLLVHHGLFWNAPEPVTGRNYRRLRALLEGGVAVYSAHLPLDCHPQVGNNRILARMLGLRDLQDFGSYEGFPIGVVGETDQDLDGLCSILEAELGASPTTIAPRPETPGPVAVVTGAGGSFLAEARTVGVGTLVTGEAPHHAFFDAEEWGVNLILAGHYATETVGVRALGEKLAAEFEVEADFFDYPTGL